MREVKAEDVTNEVSRRVGDGGSISFTSVTDSSQCLDARIEFRKENIGDDFTMEWLGPLNEDFYLVKLNQHQIVCH